MIPPTVPVKKNEKRPPKKKNKNIQENPTNETPTQFIIHGAQNNLQEENLTQDKKTANNEEGMEGTFDKDGDALIQQYSVHDEQGSSTTQELETPWKITNWKLATKMKALDTFSTKILKRRAAKKSPEKNGTHNTETIKAILREFNQHEEKKIPKVEIPKKKDTVKIFATSLTSLSSPMREENLKHAKAKQDQTLQKASTVHEQHIARIDNTNTQTIQEKV
ncbi:hypothetical protein ACJMK2_044573, partial [Sinanodonta woodiana]